MINISFRILAENRVLVKKCCIIYLFMHLSIQEINKIYGRSEALVCGLWADLMVQGPNRKY